MAIPFVSSKTSTKLPTYLPIQIMCKLRICVFYAVVYSTLWRADSMQKQKKQIPTPNGAGFFVPRR